MVYIICDIIVAIRYNRRIDFSLTHAILNPDA